jgi:arginyl-tRNA synthetase
MTEKTDKLINSFANFFVMDKFRKAIVGLLKNELPLTEKEIELLVEKPKNPALGDYAFPCFVLAKPLRDDPQRIAAELKQKLKTHKLIKKVENRGAYINFFVSKDCFAAAVLEAVLRQKERYASLNLKNKHALIEHSSINPNASPHVGRARNALIGDALARILRFAGYKTETHFYVNDVGKQIAILVLGCDKKKPAFDKLLNVYVAINKKIEQNPALKKEVFELLYRLEKGDKEVKKRFRETVEVCIRGQSKIFSEIGIAFDFFDYESDYLWSGETKNMLEKLKKTGRVFVDEENRNVLDLSGFGLAMKAPLFVLTRADGTSLYSLRDIAYTIDKLKRGKDKNIIVLGEDHKLYYQELSAALSLLGYKAPEVVHYSFVLLKESRMSTRHGAVVLLEDFLQEAFEKAKREITKRNPKIASSELNKLAKIIGYGAVKYSVLKVSPEKNVVFDWEQALSFEGDSAPYIQYAYARIQSILRKHGKPLVNADYSKLTEAEEQELIRLIGDFPEMVQDSIRTLKPHIIASHAYSLAEKFNEFYHKHTVLKAGEETKRARLVLISCTAQVLKTALSLLGIEAPKRM